MPATFTRLFYLKFVLHIPSSRKDVSRKLITTLLNTKQVKLSQASHSKWILQHGEENAIIFIIFYNNVLQAHEVVKKRYLASIQKLFIAYKTTHAENRLHYGTVVTAFEYMRWNNTDVYHNGGVLRMLWNAFFLTCLMNDTCINSIRKPVSPDKSQLHSAFFLRKCTFVHIKKLLSWFNLRYVFQFEVEDHLFFLLSHSLQHLISLFQKQNSFDFRHYDMFWRDGCEWLLISLQLGFVEYTPCKA